MFTFTPQRALGALVLLALVAGAVGCEQGARRLSLDKDLARESFVTFLEAWKQGERPAALNERSPQIIAGDADWNAGRKLVGYRVLGTESDDGTNLHTTAALVVLDANGREHKQQVTYIVGTSPVVTIFRK